ncbi:MAG: hypothetical protein DRJ50_00170 [Actinobacteria bacterium]|nr:MAG: hypothetical protein DRJ50_00170 [Actinomycetota bacterium]
MPWIARVAWIIVAVVGGSAIEAAVEDRSMSVRYVAGVGGWTIWAVVALALAIASVRSLTAARVGTPLALAAVLATALAGAPAVDLALLGFPAFVACVSVFTAEFGRVFVQASAYGDEERFPLRAPAAVGAAAITAWFVWAACLISGPLLLAAESWIFGALITALAIAEVVLLGPRWDRLSQRWFVLVPAGIVLHDPVVLADTLALRKAQVANMRLAPADTEAADFTGPASGYAIEVTTTESVTAVYAFTPAEPNGKAIHLTAFLISPSRPGQALRASASRGLPVS